nr:MAG TPA: hypothetical protein [Ackermannviridae sp.]
MQSIEKLWLSKEEQWNCDALRSKARSCNGIARQRRAVNTRGDDTAKLSYARLQYAMKSKAVARNSFARQRRSVDGTGSGTAKKRCDVQRR